MSSSYTDFDGKTVIVTGAGSGVGRAAALELASLGARVVVADLRGGEETVSAISAAGGAALHQRTDVSQAEEVQRMVAAAVERFGALHFAFNNAGVAQLNRVPLHETDEATWSGIMNVNLKGIWLCMKYEVPELLKSGQGAAIVNTSSGSSPLGYPNIGSYVASKAGVDALTRVAAIELAGKGIRVNGINPGYIGTPMLTAVMNPDDLKRLAQNTPLQKLTTAEDISRTAVWLLSSAAGHVTGQSIFVDGGISVAL